MERKYTIKEVKEVGKKFGFSVISVKKELMIYPKGKRKESCCTLSRVEAIKTIEHLALQEFKSKTETKVTCEVYEALSEWFKKHGVEWKEKLADAWYTGNYGYKFAGTNIESTLQKFRNVNGYEILFS